MNDITITLGGVTKTSVAWGFTYCRYFPRSKATSTLILDMGGADPAANPIVAYGGDIIFNAAMGDGTTFVFKGTRTKFDAEAYPDAPRTSYEFSDVWARMEWTTFQHFWKLSDGAGGVINRYFSRLNLFQDISAGVGVAWAYLNSAGQIRQIIDFARNQCGLPVQYGDVDPLWNMPVFSVKAISCAYAAQLVMKPMPDVTTKFNYSTTPPTLSIKQRQNCIPKTLPYAGIDAHGRIHKQTPITPRPDLQVPQVVIQYQINSTIAGVTREATFNDAYPPGANGLAEGAQVIPYDLRGVSDTIIQTTLESESCDPTTTAFWQKFKNDLSSTDITSLSIVDTTINGGANPDGITILDDAGNPVSLADLPNRLLPSQSVAAWMRLGGGAAVVGKQVTIKATLKYAKNTTTATPWIVHAVDKHVVTERITLTNSPVGVVPYQTLGSSDSGDPIPLNLAYVIWCSCNNVPVRYILGIATPPATVPLITDPENFQWEGTHEIIEKDIYEIITPANVLNISGGNADWAEMNAVIYGVDIDFFAGRTVIQFGPFKHLQAGEYFDMVTAWRHRQTWDNPNLRNTGASTGTGAADIGGKASRENTSDGIPQQKLHSTYVAITPASPSTTSYVAIQHDAGTNGGQITAQTFKSDSTIDPALPQVALTQNDLGVVAGVGRIAKWRNVTVGGTTIKVAASADFSAGGSGYRGEYDSGLTYAVGDIVRKRSGGSQGVWICVIANPTASHVPTFPEPADTGGINYWELLALGLQTTSVCSGGTKSQTFNATPPS